MKLKILSVLVIIVLLAVFLRFFRLGDVPNGLYQDETAIGYNAYSILETGNDEHGRSYPLYFKSFGDHKLPVYIYADMAAVKLFGLTPFAVRFPSALFGVLTVVVMYFFIHNLTRNKGIAIISTLFIAINPWSLHYNRATFEVSMSLFFFIIGGLLVNKFFQQKTRGAFLIGSMCFLISLYSYNLTRLLAPVLFALFIVANRRDIKSSDKKELVATGVLGALSLFPFVTSLLKSGGVSSASGTLIFSSAVVQAPLIELRSYMINLPFGIPVLLFNKYILTAWQYINNVASYFSVDFFFIKGSAHGNHGIGNIGLFYLFELPLMACGLVYMIKKKIRGTYLLIGWGIVTILVASLTRDVPHATRSFPLLLPLTVFSAAGAVYIFQRASSLKQSTLRLVVFVGASLFVIFNIIYYFTSYYVRFPVLYAKPWRMHDRELALYLSANDEKYEKIIIDGDTGFVYTSLLFYSKYSPSDFQKSVRRLPDDPEGFSVVRSFGKYEFRTINWKKDLLLKKSLLITNPGNYPPNTPILRKIYFPQRPVVLAEDQEIFQHPLTDEAYVLVKTK